MPPVQLVLHPPQLFESVKVFTHFPLQIIRPDGHTHTPLGQVAPVGHLLPHLPQLLGSLLRFTQVPLVEQLTKFASQDIKTQVPLTQSAVPFLKLHLLPHLPQLLISLFVSVQAPLQVVWPDWQHFPFEQIRPDAQAVPHLPQFFASVFVSVQVPLQVVWFEAHPHAPSEQICPDGQTVPQSPQWLASLLVFTHLFLQ